MRAFPSPPMSTSGESVLISCSWSPPYRRSLLSHSLLILPRGGSAACRRHSAEWCSMFLHDLQGRCVCVTPIHLASTCYKRRWGCCVILVTGKSKSFPEWTSPFLRISRRFAKGCFLTILSPCQYQSPFSLNSACVSSLHYIDIIQYCIFNFPLYSLAF